MFSASCFVVIGFYVVSGANPKHKKIRPPSLGRSGFKVTAFLTEPLYCPIFIVNTTTTILYYVLIK